MSDTASRCTQRFRSNPRGRIAAPSATRLAAQPGQCASVRRLVPSIRHALVRAALVWCSLLALLPTDAIAQARPSRAMSPATYNGSVLSAAYPSSNPDCTSPPVSCSNSQSLTAPGALAVDAPGTSLESSHLTFGIMGPSISVFAASLPLTSDWVRGLSRAQGVLNYFVEIVGPQASVPVMVTVTGGVSASNGFYGGPLAGTSAAVSVTVTQSGVGTTVACAASPFPEVVCSAQQSISGTYALWFEANTPITVSLNAMAWTYSVGYTGVYSAFVDPMFSVDPSFPTASSYTVLVSPGIIQEGAVVFADGFEDGGVTNWSTWTS